MIIYWKTLEKDAADTSTIPQYIASDYVPSVHFARNIYWESQKQASGKDVTIPQYIASNPHKFHVYQNTAQTTYVSTFSKLRYDARLFDTSSDFDISTNHHFIAPVDGYYFFSARTSLTQTANPGISIINFCVNGAECVRGDDLRGFLGVEVGLCVSSFIHLSAGDTVDVRVWTLYAYTVSTGPIITWFSGYLVCQT